MTRLLKVIISALFHVMTTATARVRRRTRGRCVVLYYHGVKASQRAAFRRQMGDVLARCEVVDPAATRLARPGARAAAVTFDDGFRSVADHALPVLLELGIPSAVFVPSGNLGRAPAWSIGPGEPDEREVVMDEDELRSLPSLVTVGSHGVHHSRLLTIDSSAVTSELADSRTALQSITGQPVELFSFPYGEFSPEIVERCREVGYERVFTSVPTPVADGGAPFVVGRVTVTPDDWRWEFRLKLAGAYRWVPVASAIKRRLRRKR